MAEQKVQSIAFQSDMEYVILRPALVYGPGNPGNLARLIKLVGTGLPLPFKGIAGKRSMVSVNYLVQILVAASTLREATNQTYLVADGQDLTLSSIVQAFAEGLNVPVRLFNCPLSMLSLISNLVGKTAELQKLMGTFQISPQKLQCDFGIAPFLGAKESLAMTANSFRREINNG
jgi:nucleoside-diphosphate-sugar epimerase